MEWSRFMTIHNNKLFIASHVSNHLCYVDLTTFKMYSSLHQEKSDLLHNGKIYKLYNKSIIRVVDVYTFEHLYDCVLPCGIEYFDIKNGILNANYYGSKHVVYYKLLDE